MEERFTPKMLVDYRLRLRGMSLDELGLAPVVVITWMSRVARALTETTGAQLAQKWFYSQLYPLYTGEVAGKRVSFSLMPIGAPATIAIMEEMIACGVRTFIGLGQAGSLQPASPVGSFIIPTSCIREEGTRSVMDDGCPLPGAGQ